MVFIKFNSSIYLFIKLVISILKILDLLCLFVWLNNLSKMLWYNKYGFKIIIKNVLLFIKYKITKTVRTVILIFYYNKQVFIKIIITIIIINFLPFEKINSRFTVLVCQICDYISVIFIYILISSFLNVKIINNTILFWWKTADVFTRLVFINGFCFTLKSFYTIVHWNAKWSLIWCKAWILYVNINDWSLWMRLWRHQYSLVY